MTKTRDEIAHYEATRDPIFLLQRKNIIITNVDSYHYNDDTEALCDQDNNEVTLQDILKRGDAVETWDTESVWLTREEATAYGERTEYHYLDGWRVYCVNAEGELAKFLKTYDVQGA